MRVLSWIFRYEICVKLQPHSWHLNGFSFEWELSCLFKLDSQENTFLHWTHSKGFLLLWVLMCRLRLDGPEKDLFHRRHLNCLSPTESFLDELLWWIVLNKDVLSPGTSIPASTAKFIMVSTSFADTFSDSQGVLSVQALGLADKITSCSWSGLTVSMGWIWNFCRSRITSFLKDKQKDKTKQWIRETVLHPTDWNNKHTELVSVEWSSYMY